MSKQSNPDSRPSRRAFLAGAAAALTLPRFAVGAVGANDRLALGFIGVGVHGRALMAQKAGIAAALCDVDERPLHRAAALTQPGVRLYRDYRKLLEQDDLDGIVIAAPDHWHVPQAIDACESGKAVFVAAPACHRLGEASALLRAARRSAEVVCIDVPATQSAAGAALLRAVRDKAFGEIREVTATAAPNRGGGDAKNALPPPPQLDWNAWLGPKLRLPYNPDYTGENYRWLRALGGGRVCGEGVHAFDLALACLHGDSPLAVKVSAAGMPQNEGLWDCPRTLEAAFEFDSPKWTLHWKQAADAGAGETCTLRVRGEKAEARVRQCDIKPALETTLKDVDLKESSNALPPLARWADAVRKEQPDVASVARTCRAAQLAQLANLAWRLRRPLEWREEEGRFVNDEQADRAAMGIA